MNIPKDKADTMANAGNSSKEKRGQEAPRQFITPIARKTMTQAGETSKEKREATTENIAKHYADNGGK